MKQFSDITNVWEWKDYDDFNEKYGPNNNPEDYASFLVLITYFEGVGVLVKRGLINADFVDDLLSGLIIRLWEKYETYIISLREIRQWPQFAEYVEYLYNEMIRIRAKKGHLEILTTDIYVN